MVELGDFWHLHALLKRKNKASTTRGINSGKFHVSTPQIRRTPTWGSWVLGKKLHPMYGYKVPL